MDEIRIVTEQPAIWTVLLSGFLGAVIASVLTWLLTAGHDRRMRKRDLRRRAVEDLYTQLYQAIIERKEDPRGARISIRIAVQLFALKISELEPKLSKAFLNLGPEIEAFADALEQTAKARNFDDPHIVAVDQYEESLESVFPSLFAWSENPKKTHIDHVRSITAKRNTHIKITADGRSARSSSATQ